MALIESLASLLIVLVLACLAIAFGTRMLGWLDLSVAGCLERSLYAAGLAFTALQMVSFILGLLGWLNQALIIVVLGTAALVAGKDWLQVPRLAEALIRAAQRARHSSLTLTMMIATLVCLVVDALLAMAPLTGSDAMVYHFTAPLLEMGKRWAPIFWLAMSLYAGLGHILIQLGMTLGSDHISMGLVYLGGVFTVGTLFVLTRYLASERWAWVAVLTFVATPMVYWQMCISGAPDIWMAFDAVLSVLALAKGTEGTHRQWLCLAGFLAGAAAGVKYTGWVIPAVIVGACFVTTRSWKWSALCGLWSLPAGGLVLARNAWWAGDPFFPYLTRWLTPSRFNAYTASAILQDVRAAGFNRSLAGVLAYPFAMTWRGEAYGVGHYFGPIVLAFAPLLWFAVRKGLVARISLGLWAGIFLANALTSQGARFLLPCYPLALAMVVAGLAEACRRKYRMVRIFGTVSLIAFLLFGIISESLYAKDFLPVALGLEERQAFLERQAPDYPTVSYINSALKRQEGKVLVFFRHVYYLRVPYIIGDPHTSWLMDPDRLTSPQKLLQFFHQQGVQWVVKAPDYPEPFTSAFQTLEDEGKLRPMFSADVSTYSAFRIYGEKVPVHVVILEVVSVP